MQLIFDYKWLAFYLLFDINGYFVLIKALQEQQAIIEQQNAQIETLLTDNSLLKEKDDTQDKSIEALVSRLNLLESKSSH